MRKIHVLGTPMEIVSPKKRVAVDRLGPVNRVEPDLLRGVDPSGWGRRPQDFWTSRSRSGQIGFNVIAVPIRARDPMSEVRELLRYVEREFPFRGASRLSILLSESRARAIQSDIEYIAARMAQPGINRLYDIPIHIVPPDVPLIISCVEDLWMCVGVNQ